MHDLDPKLGCIRAPTELKAACHATVSLCVVDTSPGAFTNDLNGFL